MSKVTELSNIVIMLIRAGAVFRLSYIFLQMAMNEDGVQSRKKRIKHTIKFYIVAELVFALKTLIMSYF